MEKRADWRKVEEGEQSRRNGKERRGEEREREGKRLRRKEDWGGGGGGCGGKEVGERGREGVISGGKGRGKGSGEGCRVWLGGEGEMGRRRER